MKKSKSFCRLNEWRKNVIIFKEIPVYEGLLYGGKQNYKALVVYVKQFDDVPIGKSFESKKTL